MKNRSRQWNIDENNYNIEDFKNTMLKLSKIKGLFYAYCFHNEDTPHYHLVICTCNALSFDSVKKKFSRAHIEATIDLVSSIQYLTHKNEPEKIQYEYEDIVTNNQEKLKSYYDGNYSFCYIDDDSELYSDLKKGYDLSTIITSEKYSLSYLNRRINIIERAIEIYYKKRINQSAYARCIDNLYHNGLLPFDSESSVFKTLQEERKTIEILDYLN